ncbi:hypothetical protein VP1G_03220 [Cytospora mali]|uniref:Uncharacterized protein n=1 Tax=Cytospora mali TaxID=578113 RepID=A0A194UW69_CYTMA|nr:hypothetical protein VP1G_03220 [Valsa mali var. pyri (nom. inval.)]
MSTTHMSACKLAKVAELVKLHKLAAKLAKRHEIKNEKNQARKAQNEQKVADFEKRIEARNATAALYEAQRRADFEKDPTNPRNIQWKKRQDKRELLEKSRWARVKENVKDAGKSLCGCIVALIKSILHLVIILILLPFAILECFINALCFCDI